MRYTITILIALFVLYTQATVAQQTKGIPVTYSFVYGDAPLELERGQPYDGYVFTTLRYYISNIQLYDRGKLQWEEQNSYHLLDLSATNTLKLNLAVPESLSYDQIRFHLGIDSTTNVSGAMGGDLDPTKGMYWTWQSGYINFKLEGTNPACPTRKNEFHFHLGGYAAPFATIQTVQLKVSNNKSIQIIGDISKLLKDIDPAEQNTVMIPGKEAVMLSRKAAGIFSIK